MKGSGFRVTGYRLELIGYYDDSAVSNKRQRAGERMTRDLDATAAGLVDTHAHLAEPDLRADLPGILSRARESGVVQVIAVGTTATDSLIVQDLAARNRGVFATAGVHPNHVSEAARWRLGNYRAAGWSERGCGDWRDRPGPLSRSFAVQPATGVVREASRAWSRAKSPGGDPLPRGAEADIIARSSSQLGRPIRGVLHSFAGAWDQAQAFLELGLDLSFAGMVTFTNKSLDTLRETASRIPIDRILVETDSPYLSPHPFRGKTNEPARVVR